MNIAPTSPLWIAALLFLSGPVGSFAQTAPATESTSPAEADLEDDAAPESRSEDHRADLPVLPSPLRSGPMLGPAEIADARIWLQTLWPTGLQLRFWPEGAPEASRLSEEIRTSPEHDHIALFELTGLRYGATYEYEVYAEGERLELPWARTFSTQELWQWRTDPPPVRLAAGSCAYINDSVADRPGTPYGSDFHIFDAIAAADPDLMVWVGDNIYLREVDFWSRASIRARHAQNRELPELRRLFAATAHYGTWDDHDYGPNNSDRTYREKEAALEAFLDYFPNPGAGIPGTDGVFTRFQWADLEVFLLDGRYHRTPPLLAPGMRRQMFGPEQLTWLVESLASSHAAFKIVVSGSQVLNPQTVDARWYESFELYPEEKRRLLDALEAIEVEGVIFLSGDRHHSELIRIDRGNRLYPLLDMTTSSLTAGLARAEPENPARVPGSWTNEVHNYVLFEVDGPRTERRLTLRLMDDRGDEIWRYEIPAGALDVPAKATLPATVTLARRAAQAASGGWPEAPTDAPPEASPETPPGPGSGPATPQQPLAPDEVSDS